MKRKFITTAAAAAMCAMSFAQVKVASNGNMAVGINPTTTDRLLISGGALKIGNSAASTDRAVNMIKIGDSDYIQIGEWEADDVLSFKATHYNFTKGNIGVGLPSGTTPLTKFQIGDIWTFYDGTGDKEICRNARYASSQYWRINTSPSSLISFTYAGDILFRTSTSGTAGTAITQFNDVVIKSNGYVGIGMQNPLAKLHIDINDGRKILFDGWVDTYFDLTGTSGAAALYPVNNYWLQLGKTGQRLGDIFVGTIRVSFDMIKDSDTRLKENIVVLENPLQKIMRVSAYNYNFKKEFFPEDIPAEATTKYAKKQIGFLAQELEKEFPELVSPPDEENEYYGVNYIGMIPVLLEAIKEQQKMIDKQQQRIEQLEKGNNVTANTLKSLNTNAPTATQEMHLSDSQISETLKLYQNAPNPFNERTVIQCFVPQNIQKAQLCVYNMKGIRVQCLSITERGDVEIHIEAGALSSGVYSYVLIGDGATSDTKQMILTK